MSAPLDNRSDSRDPVLGSGDAPPRDELDLLLRDWHSRNAERAARGRAQLLDALRIADAQPASVAARSARPDRPFSFRSFVMHPYFRAAACLALLLGLFGLLLPFGERPATADVGLVQVPDGGRLDAVDDQGALVGPCPLKHTDVNVNIGAQFSRVVLRQTYTNPYPFKIEAVYTFPLSSRGAVDRMSMTVGDRVVVGEVKERERARQIYEAARASGYVASLLEQERPNIFTQTIANIEPGVTVIVEIAYVETLQSKDGEFRFDFPMVVGPRYIPGYPSAGRGGGLGGRILPQPLPPGFPPQFVPARGIGLLGPASVELAASEGAAAPIAPAALLGRLGHGIPIDAPGLPWETQSQQGAVTTVAAFTVAYADGAKEQGELFSDGAATVNGRWVWCPPTPTTPAVPAVPGFPDDNAKQVPAANVPEGAGFAPDTDQVPDASRITPMPTRPPLRAGHDISLTVTVDSGGPTILDLKSLLHEVTVADEGAARRTLALTKRSEIPNRDFVLSWRTDAAEIAQSVLTDVDPRNGGFMTVVLAPPPRVAESAVRPRELVFVLDTSGSMNGFPIEKAKMVMAKAIDAMRPADTFNMITFAGDTHVLWPEPRPATPENRAAAQAFLASRQGRGGTEMMKAIDAALRQDAGPGGAIDPMALANLPADGRQVSVIAPYSAVEVRGDRYGLRVSDGIVMPMTLALDLPTVLQPQGVRLRLTGAWKTVRGERVFEVAQAAFAEKTVAPMRICMFLTDGFVGNDQAIVAAVRANAGTTRVFSFGIGNSVNRWLLEQVALAGRGESEFVTLAEESDSAVQRFTRRIQNPVLTDIAVRFEGIAPGTVGDVVPGTPSNAPGLLPDLYDVSPLVLHARFRPVGEAPTKATMVVSGNSGSGPWEKRVPIELPATRQAFVLNLDGREVAVPLGNDALPVLWARSKVEQVLAPHLKALQEQALDPSVRAEVVALGERFSILTPFTSFVAVEKARVTLGGKSVLVPVPIELPEGLRWEGFFGEMQRQPVAWRDAILTAAQNLDDADRQNLHFGVALEGKRSAADGKGPGKPGEPRGASPLSGAPAAAAPASLPSPPPPPPPPAPPSPLAASAPAPTGAPAPGRRPGAPAGDEKARFAELGAGLRVDAGAAVAGKGKDPGQRSNLAVLGDIPAPTVAGQTVRHVAAPANMAVPRSRGGISEIAEIAAPGSQLGVDPRTGWSGGGGGGGLGGGRARDIGGAPVLGRSSGVPSDRLADKLEAASGSGSIFGSPGNGPHDTVKWTALSADDRAEVVGSAVMTLITPELWVDNGGTMLIGRVDTGAFLIEPAPQLVPNDQIAGMLKQAIVARDAIVAASIWPGAAPAVPGSVPAAPGGNGPAPAPAPAPASASAPALAPATTVAPVASPQPLPIPVGADGATVVLYDVRDLVGDAAPQMDVIGTTLREVLTEIAVDPDRWSDNGGQDAVIEEVGPLLAVRAPAEIHAKIAGFLDAMRGVVAARNAAVKDAAPLRARWDGMLLFDVSALAAVATAEQIASALHLVDPQSWMDNGGESGMIRVVDGVLFVRQTPANLDRVETLLDQMSAARGAAVAPDRRGAVDAAQLLPLPDGAMHVIVHRLGDVAALAAAEVQGDASVTAAAIADLACEAVAATLSRQFKDDPAEVLQGLFRDSAQVGPLLVVAAPVAVQERVDDVLQEVRAAFMLPPAPLRRTPEAAAVVAATLRADEVAQRTARLNALYRTLDPRLFARVVEIEDPTRVVVDRDVLAQALGGRDAVPAEGAVALSVLVDEVNPARIAALRKAGLSVEAENDRLKIVAGWAPPANLAAIALVEGVRRIEPVER